MSELTKFDQLQARITDYISPLKGILVRDAAENASAKGALVTVKGLAKEIDSLKAAALAPHKLFIEQVNARVKELLTPLDAAEAEIKRVMGAYASAEQKRIADERARVEEEARKKRAEQEAAAKAEREKLEAQDRARRAEAELAKKAESAFGVSDEAAEKKRQADSAEMQRKKREADDKAQRDREMAQREARAAEKAFVAAAPKGVRMIKQFEVTEPLEVPQKYWMINEALLGKDVRAGIENIPGVRIFEEQVVVAR